jgi:hypothetical protein
MGASRGGGGFALPAGQNMTGGTDWRALLSGGNPSMFGASPLLGNTPQAMPFQAMPGYQAQFNAPAAAPLPGLALPAPVPAAPAPDPATQGLYINPAGA